MNDGEQGFWPAQLEDKIRDGEHVVVDNAPTTIGKSEGRRDNGLDALVFLKEESITQKEKVTA